ncbi:hypothetical protein [Lacinutrix venerupis]|uniref:Uncharacterized protein n=1 Tax=Lacinutrix venerupis TaxID=1486034 RepID=A0AAC9LLS0_9FLAO|nr:hypothetical protein [Lacinutrix venerupis]APX99912.1 hypothetical protein BWR22_06185 [Lacinutrix venerupis]
MNDLIEWLDLEISKNNLENNPVSYLLNDFGIAESNFKITIRTENGLLKMGERYPEGSYPIGTDWVLGKTANKKDFINEIVSYLYNTDGFNFYDKILNYYKKSPINFWEFYINFKDVVNNHLFDNSIKKEDLNKTIRIQQESTNFFQSFANDKDFIKNFKVFVFKTISTSSTRRTDYYYDFTDYVLFHNGIAVTDDYIKGILPEKIHKSERDYNDSIPRAGNKESVKFNKNNELTLDFLKKYDLNEHLKFLLD